MRAEWNTTTTMNTHERLTSWVEIDGVYWTGLVAFAASNAQAFFHDHPAAPTLRIGSRRADRNTGRGFTGEAGFSFEACRQPARGQDADAGGVPRQALVHQPSTCQGTGVATDTAFYFRGGQYLHRGPLIGLKWRDCEEMVTFDGYVILYRRVCQECILVSMPTKIITLSGK